MNGQLILLLLTLVLQGQNGAVLPPGTGEFSRGLGTVATGSSECDIGYATDPNDGKYCMIVQIHPSAMAIFAKGDAGQELPVTIRSDYRNYVEKVIIRVGTGPVENMPPSAAKMSENRTNGPGFIADLKNRTPVNIDRNSDLMNASAQSGMGGGFGGTGTGSNDNSVFPPTSDKTGLQGSAGGIAGNPNRGVLPNSNVLPNNPVAPNRDIMPGPPFTQSSRANEADNFGAPPSTASYRDDPIAKQPIYSPYKPSPPSPNTAGIPSGPQYQPPGNLSNNTQNPAYSNNSTYPGGTNYGTGSNLSYNNNGTNTNATNGGFATNGNQGNPYPTIANSPISNNPNTNNPNSYSNPFPGQPTSLTQSQNNFGALPPPTPNYGASQYQPQLPSTTFAGAPNVEPRSSSHVAGNRFEPHEDQNVGRESMLPFLLLFSIVGNVYLGLWMNHLRKRYRELRISMRGLPVSEMA